MLKHLSSLTALAALAAVNASAHTSNLVPNSFYLSEAGGVTVQASFTENFPLPDVALRADTFAIISATGAVRPCKNQVSAGALTVLTAELDEEGTYRLTTGERFGRTGHAYRHNGEIIRLDSGFDELDLPVGAELLTSQTVTQADVYITQERVSPIEQRAGSRLSLTSKAHPACLRENAPIVFTVMLDGSPMPYQTVQLSRAFGTYLGDEEGLVYTTDQEGQITFETLHPGLYLLMTRHITDAPDGAETDLQSYTTSLTFDVLGQDAFRPGCSSDG